MAYTIVDIDGTLTTSGDTPNLPLIEYLNQKVMDGETQLIVVSARPVARLEETRAWLQEHGVAGVDHVYLNDFEGAGEGPAVGLAFKKFKYEKLIEEYGLADDGNQNGVEYAIDNDPEVRDMARALGLEAYGPEEVLTDEERAIVAVPAYISAAATAGLEAYEGGLGGDGLQPATVREARQLAAGEVSDEKVRRMAAWIRRHRGDWEGVPQNSEPTHPDWPGAGAVAALLWGVNPVATNGADRVLAWADKITAEALQKENNAMAREQERRAVPLGEFRLAEEDGQKVFSGYAALFDAPSAGLPFTEIITPGAFKRTLGRVAKAERVVKFLHGHDESRMLATTASGRLTLSEDEQGLRVEAKLDPADPDAAAIISKLTHEAAAMGMSFGFTVPKGGDTWEGENRTLREVNLFEVSILSGHQPAYPATLGLSAVRKVAEPRIGVDAERLISTLETVKAGKSLSDDEVEVLDAVRSALAPKPATIDPSIAAARLRLAELESESI